jgi:hypothetical protein
MANFIVTTVIKKEWQTDQKEVSEVGVMEDLAEEEEIDTKQFKKVRVKPDFFNCKF